MKKILAVILVITAILMADARFGAPTLSERPLFVQGKIKIQMTETAQSSGLLKIDNSSKSYSLTGFESVDKLNMTHSVSNIKRAHMGAKNIEMEKQLGLDRWYLLEIPKDKDVLSVVEDYKKDPNIEFANPEYLMYTQAIPNDTYHVSHHWGHNNTVQMLAWKTGDTYNHTGSPVGTYGFDTNAHAGWDGSQAFGSSTVIIGIIDSGVDTGHEDIADVAGYDFGDGDTNPFDNSAEAGHGTCCAGVAAGIANNGKGVAGTAGACKIMPLKVADSAGSMAFTSIEDALIWGADEGAHVLSMSLGAAISPGYSPATDAAIVYAYNSGCVVLAATGNENATSVSYPANHANCLAVGAASPDGLRKDTKTIDGEYWWGSNYGVSTADAADAVDFIAPTILPATDISGTAGYQTGNYYLYFNGTSCATPYAAGFAALIKSKYPTYTPAQIGALMKSSAQDVEAVGWDRESGYGMIDLQAALNTGGSPPAVPTLISPTNSSSVADLTPTFDWNDVTDATSYTIQIDNNSTFASPEATGSPTASTFTPASNLAAGTYYWRVLATNSYGSSAYCAYWTVTLTAPLPLPDVPVLLSPTNGSTVEDLTPTFDWNDAANATSYHLQIATKSNMTGLVFDSDVASSTYTPASNMAVDVYYWRVLSTNSTGSSAYTATWSANVIAPPPPPGAPTLIAPANGSGTTDTTPYFDWSDVSGTLNYEILVDNNSDFSSPLINQTGLTVSEYTAASALANGTYYWKVRGTNASGAGTYSSTWNFSIGAAPGVPVLALPTNGSLTTDLTPTFDWNDVTDATSYTILVDNNSDFSSPVINQSPTVSTYTPGSNLALGTYYWKVLATNTYGSSAYSGSWSFSIGAAPSAPALVSPSNGSTTADYRPVFDWNDIAGSTSYNILVDNNSDFSSPEIDQNPASSTYTAPADLAIGTYYWKVSVTNAYGTGAYSSVWNFTTPSPNVTVSVASISETAAPEASVQNSFNIGNTGTADLNYNISQDYIVAKADITVHSNDFTTFPGVGYTNSNFVSSAGQALIEATSSVNPITGVLTSGSFDGTACETLFLDFDQNFVFKNGSYAQVEYFNGTTWEQIYYATANTVVSQHIELPVISNNMQIRFTGYMTKKGNYASWAIDNVVVYGPGPSYTWLTIDSPTSGTVASSGSNPINYTCDAAGMTEGVYNAEITVASNDPDEPSKVIPVEFTVFQSTIIPGVPSNLVTSISGTNLVIDWDAAADATSYDVYSADDPYGTFTFETNVATNQYVVPASVAKKFYYIISKN
ncbi:MAG: S8 family serine peptidase [Candidatus Delongbacteria bacterium]|jgi:subtilisin family serine protease|nr:S8 family serine peptidase [Candidatus Delongbacteria bacterium]